MRTMKKSDAFVSNFDINQQDNKEYVVNIRILPNALTNFLFIIQL